ncbi:MAG: hypothetical protein AB7U29_16270 [Desulfobulbus sp.]
MKNVLMVFVILEIAIAINVIAAPQDIYEGTIDAEKIALMQKGMDAVKARTKAQVPRSSEMYTSTVVQTVSQ